MCKDSRLDNWSYSLIPPLKPHGEQREQIYNQLHVNKDEMFGSSKDGDNRSYRLIPPLKSHGEQREQIYGTNQLQVNKDEMFGSSKDGDNRSYRLIPPLKSHGEQREQIYGRNQLHVNKDEMFGSSKDGDNRSYRLIPPLKSHGEQREQIYGTNQLHVNKDEMFGSSKDGDNGSYRLISPLNRLSSPLKSYGEQIEQNCFHVNEDDMFGSSKDGDDFVSTGKTRKRYDIQELKQKHPKNHNKREITSGELELKREQAQQPWPQHSHGVTPKYKESPSSVSAPPGVSIHNSGFQKTECFVNLSGYTGGDGVRYMLVAEKVEAVYFVNDRFGGMRAITGP